MAQSLTIADVSVEIVKKDIRNLHLTVRPPEGRVRIAAPKRMPMEVIRLYAISKLPWIRRHQDAMRAQARETVRRYVDGESHDVWGTRYLMKVVERDARPAVELGHGVLLLHLRPGTEEARRRELLAEWYRDQVRAAATSLTTKWSSALGVRVRWVFVQEMKTKWGSCNPSAATVRMNTELAKKPLDCMEYVVVHEMIHLLEPTHNARFVALMDRFLPGWTHRREMLNRLPVHYEE